MGLLCIPKFLSMVQEAGEGGLAGNPLPHVFWRAWHATQFKESNGRRGSLDLNCIFTVNKILLFCCFPS